MPTSRTVVRYFLVNYDRKVNSYSKRYLELGFHDHIPVRHSFLLRKPRPAVRTQGPQSS